MNNVIIIVLIIFGIIALIWLYKTLKPYFLKYNTTLVVCGGLGSGKTLTSVKTAITLLRRNRFFKYRMYNFWQVKIYNKFIRLFNKINIKRNEKIKRKAVKYAKKHELTLPKISDLKLKKIRNERVKRLKPMLYSNIPIHFKRHIFGKSREWNKTLKASHILCLEEMREYSIVVIDEMPQFINQFNWNEELIQKNVNEWITYFRHYYAGHIIINCQAIDDVVVQIRRKLNQATWCFDFKKHLFGLFYTIRCCDIMIGDQLSTITTTFIEENTKLHFGMFPSKGTYDTRCYSERVKNYYKPYLPEPRYKNLKTNKILRLVKYISPLDDTTTKEQKKDMWEKGEKIWRN